jgi:hypothetical protein
MAERVLSVPVLVAALGPLERVGPRQCSSDPAIGHRFVNERAQYHEVVRHTRGTRASAQPKRKRRGMQADDLSWPPLMRSEPMRVTSVATALPLRLESICGSIVVHRRSLTRSRSSSEAVPMTAVASTMRLTTCCRQVVQVVQSRCQRRQTKANRHFIPLLLCHSYSTSLLPVTAFAQLSLV